MSDQDARERIRSLQSETIVVEAGAGTGKTTELVERIAAFVDAGLLTMDALAAITFTEAAAAELRDRVRNRLERGAHEQARPERRERCATEAARVDLAAIQTIHSFAGELLRSHPIEAGLPPGFAVWDAIRARQEFEDRFRTWLFDEVPGPQNPARRETFRRAFALGLTPEQLRALARGMQEHEDLLASNTSWEAIELPDAVAECRSCGQDLFALGELLKYARDGEADELVQEVLSAQLVAGRMAAAQTVDEALIAFKSLEGSRLRQLGNQKDWIGREGAAAIRQIKGVFAGIKGSSKQIGSIESVLAPYRTATLHAILGYLRDFTLGFAAERRASGVATFQDLLTWARDLLRDNAPARQQAHARFRQIFVDEFQDTDPLQAEIVCLLAGDPAHADQTDWRSVPWEPGVLFLVGDPKQSIYRFRRADIRIYEEVYGRAEAEGRREYLTQSFRAAVPIVTCVNQMFEELLSAERYPEPGVQAKHVPLEADPERSVGAQFGVKRIGEQGPWKASEKWRYEAAAVAHLAAQIFEDRWQVSERGKAGVTRDVDYGDICILMPARTNLRLVERALQEQGVPYRVASGTLVLDTQEVRDLLACLRAIDDPSDQVALVAALRSPAYACSDVDLFNWVDAGGELDYRGAAAVGIAPGRVLRAFQSLRAQHERRRSVSAALLVEELIRERGLAVQAYGHARPRETWRRLRYVVDRARAFAASGQPSLRALLDWLDELHSESFYDAESPSPDADEGALQIMTVHGAKGLEFPVVILAGIGSRGNSSRGPTVVPGRGQNRLEAVCGRFQTAGWDGTVEDALDEAEDVRLLYVATTRARDHLVLSLYHAGRKCSGGPCHGEQILAAVANGSIAAIPEVSLHELAGGLASGMPAEQGEEEPLDEGEWLAKRHELIRRLSAERVRTPSSLHGSRPPGLDFVAEPSDDPIPEIGSEPADAEDEGAVASIPRGRGGTTLGRAVHAALQTLDLASLANLDAVAAAAARDCGIESQTDTIRALARGLATSATVQEAMASGRYWREAPVGIVAGNVTLNGVIDLFYQLPGGDLGVVDYKTDQVPDAEVLQRAAYYGLQLGAYALALEQASGLHVAFAELLFATPAGVRPVRYQGDELARAMMEAATALTQGPAAGVKQ